MGSLREIKGPPITRHHRQNNFYQSTGPPSGFYRILVPRVGACTGQRDAPRLSVPIRINKFMTCSPNYFTDRILYMEKSAIWTDERSGKRFRSVLMQSKPLLHTIRRNVLSVCSFRISSFGGGDARPARGVVSLAVFRIPSVLRPPRRHGLREILWVVPAQAIVPVIESCGRNTRAGQTKGMTFAPESSSSVRPEVARFARGYVNHCVNKQFNTEPGKFSG